MVARSPQLPGWVTWCLAIVVMTLTFIAFIPALGNQFLNWDDSVNFTRNPDFRGLGWHNIQWMFTSFHAGHYQPITWLTLGLDFVWGGKVFGDDPTHGPGMNPKAYHITNNVLHAINAALVYLLALRVLAAALLRDDRARTWTIHLAAAISALLFGLHPMRVENVAWITERRDLVSALLLLLTVLAYLRAVRPDEAHARRWWGICLALYVLSLMAKVAGVPLPVVLLALDWYPLRRFKPGSMKRVLLEKASFLAVALVFAAIVSAGQSTKGWLYTLTYYPLGLRVVQSCYGLCFYAWKTIAPVDLLPLYELHIPFNTTEIRFLVSIAVVVIAAFGVIVLPWRRAPALLVAAICYAAFLGPVLGLFQNGPQLVADRYSYLPAMGLMMLVSGSVAWWLGRASVPRFVAPLSVAVAGLLVVTLGWMTWNQCRVWHDSETLWRFTLSRDPNSAVANNNLGGVLASKGQLAEAVEFAQRAVDIDPRSSNNRDNLREALRRTGQFRRVVQVWLDEAALFQNNPGFPYTATYHYDAGTTALQNNQVDLAIEHLSVAVAMQPNNAQSRTNLAGALSRKDRLDDAIAQYRAAIEVDPRLPHPRIGMAMLLERQGHLQDAIRALQAYLLVVPNQPDTLAMLTRLRQSASTRPGA